MKKVPTLLVVAMLEDMGDDGRTTELRRGDNGWTCLPRDPGTPKPAPVCLDRNGLAWFQAAMSGREPDPMPFVGTAGRRTRW